jgi:cell wall assembly regulator SMI1
MDVRASWARIVNWCHDHAPETAAAIRPPADAALLRQAEQATSGSWPEDLRTWYTLADGTQPTPAGYLLPFYCPLPLHSVMSHWSMWQEIWAGMIASSPHQDAEDHYDIARLEAQPAGTTAWMFLPSYVPITEDQMGDDMFVDTRSGRLRGCVTEFVKGDLDTWGPKWLSVTAMLADLADGLHAGRPVGRWQPVVDHGRLSWDVAAHS